MYRISIILVVLCLSSCATIFRQRTDTTVLEHTQRVTELEAANRDLTRRLDRYDLTVKDSIERLEFIGGRASAINNTIDGLIYLFEQYQYEVERLLQRYNEITGTGKTP